jgi:cytochrome c
MIDLYCVSTADITITLSRCNPTHEEEMMKRALFALVAAVSVTAPAFADLALATSKNCMACHAIDKKLVGPAYKDVAKKYAGQKDAADKLATKIMKGGSGVWGPVPMPANTQVNEAEAKKLAAWVLAS